MTNLPTDERRVAFEAYWRRKENFKESFLAVDGRYPDYYGNPVVQGSWEGFKSALSRQGEVVTVADLTELRDEVRAQSGLKDHYADRDETERMFTALISKAEKV